MPKMRPYDLLAAKEALHFADRCREPVPRCWFCSAQDGKRSREHIFPRWLSKELGVREQPIESIHAHDYHGIDHSLSIRPVSGWIANGICTECNNGWMSALEERARYALLNGWSSDANDVEILDLALWLVKTAFVINVSQPFRLLTTARDRHQLANGQIPDNVAVFVGRRKRWEEDLTLLFAQTSPSAGWSPPGMGRRWFRSLVERSLVVTLGVGPLVAWVVIRARPTQCVSVNAPANLVQIWPPSKLSRYSQTPYVKDVDESAPSITLTPSAFGEPYSLAEQIEEYFRDVDTSDEWAMQRVLDFHPPMRMRIGDVWPQGSWSALRVVEILQSLRPESAFVVVGSNTVLEVDLTGDVPEVGFISLD